MTVYQENMKKPVEDAETAEKPIGDRPFIAFTAATTVGIFFALRTMGVGQYDALLASTSLVWLMSLPVWER